LLLYEVQVDEPGLAIGEQAGDQIEHDAIGALHAVEAPAQAYPFRHGAHDLHHFRRGDGSLGFERERRHRLGLPTAEIFVHHGDRGIVVQITGEHHGHVVGHVVGIEVLMDLYHARVLQMLSRTDGGLCSVGMLLVQVLRHGGKGLPLIIVLPAVELFKNRFQFGMEQPQHQLLEAHAFDHHPLLQCVARDIVHVHRALRTGECVGATGPEGRHHLVVLVGHGELGCFVAQTIDAFVQGLPFCFIGRVAPQLVGIADLLQQGALLRPVQRGNGVGALEEHVLQVVRKTGRRGRVVLATGPGCDVRLHPRLVLVLAQVDLETVGQGVDAHLHRVVGNARVLVFLLG
jgi:hypothetical protein